ncbi:alanine:cation symporter family protein [Demequina sp. B12]|uniref:alanine/glycine:cation symporter family protein n=1 Tax=Demequina sp. B12 TaxID=2992757 RepID=UPI00237C1103|nr:alanine/glycine:cation symporter family protein [Demequina sp. B12]MDE0572975.1 alanine:cation symporter family protein [Demequina sp. B12]
MSTVDVWVATAVDDLWTWVAAPIVLVMGLYFTVRTGLVQVRLLPRMVRSLTDATPVDAQGRPQSLSAFQAFTLSAASRVGIGNIAGVGTAIAIGGPGAVFWMWMMALINGATSFVEATLAQLYKRRSRDGFVGGPAYYMERGVGSRALGMVYAAVLIVSVPFVVNSLQAYTISETVTGAFGADPNGPVPWVIAVFIALSTGLVVFGGVRRIAHFTASLVPSMAVLYLTLGILIVGSHLDQVVPVFEAILTDAFTGNSVAGGAVGSVFVVGVQRGMFSNEAGLGTAPNAAASAATTHPVKQGLVQTLGVYFDTFIVCSITAFIILVAVPDLSGASRGIELTETAVMGTLGAWAGYLLALIVFLLAFSTILGSYYYGEANISYLTSSRAVMRVFRIGVVACVGWGCLAQANVVWTLSDGALAVMALINIPVLGVLSRHVVALLRNYSAQVRAGQDPVFVRDTLPNAGRIDVWESEETVTGRPPPHTNEG